MREVILRKQFYKNCFLWRRPSQNLLRTHTKSLYSTSPSSIESSFRVTAGNLYESESLIRSLCEKSVPQVEDAFHLFNQAIDSHGPPSESTCSFLFITLSKLKKYNLAIKVYNAMSGIRYFRSYLSLGSLIECFVHSNEPDFAIGVLALMIRRGFEVNIYSINVIVIGFCQNGDVFRAVKLFHEWLPVETDTSRRNPNLFTYTILIDGLGKQGKMEEAMNLLEDMKLKGLNADIVTYGTLINGFCDAGDFDRAKQLSDIMMEKGIAPNEFIYSSLLRCLSKTRRWEEASDLLNVMSERGIQPNVVIYNHLIDDLCKDGRPLEAMRLLNLMVEKGEEPNTTTYNSLINGLCNSGLFNDAFKVFEDMKPDVVSFNTLASRLSKNGKVDESIELLQKVTEPDCYTLTGLIDGLCRKGQIREAEEIHCKMIQKPNMLSFNSLIRAYLKEGCVEKVMQLLRNVVEVGLVLNSHTYLLMIRGFCSLKMINVAKGLFLHMRARGISITTNHFNALLDNLCKDGCLEEAKGLFNSMANPDAISYNSLIHGILKAGDLQSGKELFDEMIRKGVSPDSATFSILVNGFIKLGWLEEAKLVLEKMLSCGYDPSVAVYDSLLKGFCEMDEKDDFFGLLDRMAAKGVCLDGRITRTILNCLCLFSDHHNIHEILPKFQRESCSEELSISCDEFLTKLRKSHPEL